METLFGSSNVKDDNHHNNNNNNNNNPSIETPLYLVKSEGDTAIKIKKSINQ